MLCCIACKGSEIDPKALIRNAAVLRNNHPLVLATGWGEPILKLMLAQVDRAATPAAARARR
jgi:hypothetical protein